MVGTLGYNERKRRNMTRIHKKIHIYIKQRENARVLVLEKRYLVRDIAINAVKNDGGRLPSIIGTDLHPMTIIKSLFINNNKNMYYYFDYYP